MSSAATAVRAYSGSAPEPVEWRVLEEIFDAIFGSDVRDLKSWPERMHHVAMLAVPVGGGPVQPPSASGSLRRSSRRKRSAKRWW
jgi:hypothetical protein